MPPKRKKDKTKNRKKNSFIGTQKKTKVRKRKFKSKISQKRYTMLVEKKKSKKKLTKNEIKDLDDELHYRYCKCLLSFERKGDVTGYPICMNSVYKKRGFDPPKGSSQRCKNRFKK